jgi:uncharacterized protein YgiM (DUF1202 family)
MALQDKYAEIIQAAQAAGIGNLQVADNGGQLVITGDSPNAAAVDNLYAIQQRLDPGFASSDLVMNFNILNEVAGAVATVVTESTNLNIRREPSTDAEVVGKAAKGEKVTIVSKHSDQWFVVRTKDGEEGYAYAQYLEVK